jgi:hypothetical protein
MAFAFSAPVGEGLFHRLAGRSDDGILDHAVGTPPHGPSRWIDRHPALMVCAFCRCLIAGSHGFGARPLF